MQIISGIIIFQSNQHTNKSPLGLFFTTSTRIDRLWDFFLQPAYEQIASGIFFYNQHTNRSPLGLFSTTSTRTDRLWDFFTTSTRVDSVWDKYYFVTRAIMQTASDIKYFFK